MKIFSLRGHTLIELLVVIVIIGITSSVLMLTIGRNHQKDEETFSKELLQTLSLAEEQALLQPATLGLILTSQSFGFYAYQPEKNTAHWQALQDRDLGEQTLPDNIQISPKKTRTASAEPSPVLVIAANGTMTPFTLYVGRKDQAPLYEIVGESDGSLTRRPYQG